MKEHIRTEEAQKKLIFNIFSEWQNSTYSDRTQTYFLQLCEQIYKWYKDYRSNDVNNMGVEITQVIKNFMNKDKKLNIPKDKDDFFKYLNTSLSNEKNASYREYNENKKIKISKEMKQKLKEIEEFIKNKEIKLASDEHIQNISEEFEITKKKAREYLYLINNNINIIRFYFNYDGEDKNILDLKDLKPPYMPYSYEEPESAIFTNFNLSIVKSLLDKKQERSRDCYRALLTLHCIKNGLKGWYPILDHEIIDSYYKYGTKPKQYEIYLKYHPETDKKSAEVQASTNLREFLDDIETCLKENNK